ncbi:MAG: putative ubiquitin carboxyl-terminal hydrolase FAF-X, partial [Paramarteilia canceri]
NLIKSKFIEESLANESLNNMDNFNLLINFFIEATKSEHFPIDVFENLIDIAKKSNGHSYRMNNLILKANVPLLKKYVERLESQNTADLLNGFMEDMKNLLVVNFNSELTTEKQNAFMEITWKILLKMDSSTRDLYTFVHLSILEYVVQSNLFQSTEKELKYWVEIYFEHFLNKDSLIAAKMIWNISLIIKKICNRQSVIKKLTPLILPRGKEVVEKLYYQISENEVPNGTDLYAKMLILILSILLPFYNSILLENLHEKFKENIDNPTVVVYFKVILSLLYKFSHLNEIFTEKETISKIKSFIEIIINSQHCGDIFVFSLMKFFENANVKILGNFNEDILKLVQILNPEPSFFLNIYRIVSKKFSEQNMFDEIECLNDDLVKIFHSVVTQDSTIELCDYLSVFQEILSLSLVLFPVNSSCALSLVPSNLILKVQVNIGCSSFIKEYQINPFTTLYDLLNHIFADNTIKLIDNCKYFVVYEKFRKQFNNANFLLQNLVMNLMNGSSKTPVIFIELNHSLFYCDKYTFQLDKFKLPLQTSDLACCEKISFNRKFLHKLLNSIIECFLCEKFSLGSKSYLKNILNLVPIYIFDIDSLCSSHHSLQYRCFILNYLLMSNNSSFESIVICKSLELRKELLQSKAIANFRNSNFEYLFAFILALEIKIAKIKNTLTLGMLSALKKIINDYHNKDLIYDFEVFLDLNSGLAYFPPNGIETYDLDEEFCIEQLFSLNVPKEIFILKQGLVFISIAVHIGGEKNQLINILRSIFTTITNFFEEPQNYEQSKPLVNALFISKSHLEGHNAYFESFDIFNLDILKNSLDKNDKDLNPLVFRVISFLKALYEKNKSQSSDPFKDTIFVQAQKFKSTCTDLSLKDSLNTDEIVNFTALMDLALDCENIRYSASDDKIVTPQFTSLSINVLFHAIFNQYFKIFSKEFPIDYQINDAKGELPNLPKLYQLFNQYIANSEVKDLITITQKLNFMIHSEFTHNIIENFKQKTENDAKNFGFTGLRNLAAVCYINSVIQILLLIQTVTKKIYNSNYSNLKPVKNSKHVRYSSELLQATHKLFKKMFKSKHDTNIKCFIKNFLMNGVGINIFEQNDSMEFLNCFVDSIDEALNIFGFEKAYQAELGGVLVNQIISKECDHHKISEESFYSISIDVGPNLRNMNDSLHNFIKEDILDESNKYHCESCNSKVSIKRRCCFKTLPNYLILHLKRFNYDYNLEMIQKYNGYFEFDHVLDMQPFLLESLDSADNPKLINTSHKYFLRGIIIHSGFASGGHYYAYILCKDENNDQHLQWYKFDDEDISKINLNNKENLAECCFGSKLGQDARYGNHIKSMVNLRSAYILLYQKIPDDLQHQPIANHIVDIRDGNFLRDDSKSTQQPSTSQDSKMLDISIGNYVNLLSSLSFNTFLQSFVKNLAHRWSPQLISEIENKHLNVSSPSSPTSHQNLESIIVEFVIKSSLMLASKLPFSSRSDIFECLKKFLQRSRQDTIIKVCENLSCSKNPFYEVITQIKDNNHSETIIAEFISVLKDFISAEVAVKFLKDVSKFREQNLTEAMVFNYLSIAIKLCSSSKIFIKLFLDDPDQQSFLNTLLDHFISNSNYLKLYVLSHLSFKLFNLVFSSSICSWKFLNEIDPNNTFSDPEAAGQNNEDSQTICFVNNFNFEIFKRVFMENFISDYYFIEFQLFITDSSPCIASFIFYKFLSFIHSFLDFQEDGTVATNEFSDNDYFNELRLNQPNWNNYSVILLWLEKFMSVNEKKDKNQYKNRFNQLMSGNSKHQSQTKINGLLQTGISAKNKVQSEPLHFIAVLNIFTTISRLDSLYEELIRTDKTLSSLMQTMLIAFEELDEAEVKTLSERFDIESL